MQMLLRHKLLIAVAALIAAASAGGAYAATQTSTNPRQAFVNDMAKRLHVSPARLTAAFKAALIDRLGTMVKDGQITQEQAKRIQKRIESGRLPMFFDHGPGFRDHRPGLHGALEAAGTYLGLTNAQLFGELSSGKSLAQIAQARGKSVSGLEQALTTAAEGRLDQLVSAGVISKAKEQRLLDRLSRNIGRLVSRSSPLPPMPPDKNRPISPPIGFGPPATE